MTKDIPVPPVLLDLTGQKVGSKVVMELQDRADHTSVFVCFRPYTNNCKSLIKLTQKTHVSRLYLSLKLMASMFPFLDLGDMGGHGASGSPGKDEILHEFNIFLRLVFGDDWQQHVLNMSIVCLQGLLVKKVSRVKQERQGPRVPFRLCLVFITMILIQ